MKKIQLIALLGSNWNNGVNAGGFYWNVYFGVGSRGRFIGGRLVYIPTNGVDADAA